jgi:hypothetical protein
LGIHGNDFVKQNEGIVVEMTRKFLEYVKSAQLQAADSENTMNAESENAESEDLEMQMTPDGHPIIPKMVMEKDLRKAKWEKLLQAYLSQHYCDF